MAKDFKESHKESAYASMEKDQLISMIHFLVKREDERAQENQELKDMVKELRDTYKQDGILVDVDRYKMELRAEIEKEKKLRVAAEDKIAILEAKTKNMNYG